MYHPSSNRWQKHNTKLQTIRLNNCTDLDIIKFLETLDNKQGFLKDLIRTEMKKRGFVCPHPSKREIYEYEEYLDNMEKGKISKKEDFKNEKEN